ncbi:MAG TPA: glycoside hydrolase family 16 protein [Acidimicrobiales bacterium]
MASFRIRRSGKVSLASAGLAITLLIALSTTAPSASGAIKHPSKSTPTTTTTTTTTVPSSSCGDVGPEGISGSWTCSFDDEFNGTSLDTSNWVPQLTATSGYTTGSASGAPCYVDNPSTISVSGGYLHLGAIKTAAPIDCVDGLYTSYEAGMVTTDGLFSQTYGAFEVNAELPASVANGLQETFWLYPKTLTYGAWPTSGEIDFAEFYSEYPTLDIPYIHYTEKASDPNVTAYDCTINQGAFNTYGVDWQPGTLTIYLNGKVCLTEHPNPAAPLASPAPFNQPFMIALTQALGSGTDAYESGTTQLPATTLINWVRAWSQAA